MSKKNIDLIRQALAAAESSIKLAKQLLNDVEAGKNNEGNFQAGVQKAKELPGVMGVFDGEFMITESGEKFPVPENYSSKSMLVVGDTLKLVEEGKEKRFKQIEHVKRHKTTGILTKKDGKWRAITPEGSYKVLQASIDHYGGDVGDEVLLHLPSTNLTVGFGAIESIKGSKPKIQENTPTELKPPKLEETTQAASKTEEVKPLEKKVEVVSKKVEPKPVVEKKEVVAPKIEKPKVVEKPVVKEIKKEEPVPVADAPKIEKEPEPVMVDSVTTPMEVTPEEEELA